MKSVKMCGDQLIFFLFKVLINLLFDHKRHVGVEESKTKKLVHGRYRFSKKRQCFFLK